MPPSSYFCRSAVRLKPRFGLQQRGSATKRRGAKRPLRSGGAGGGGEKLGERGGDGDVVERVEAEQDDGALDRADLSGEPVECGVDDFEYAGGQRGVVRDDFVERRSGGLGVFNGADDLGGHLGEG